MELDAIMTRKRMEMTKMNNHKNTENNNNAIVVSPITLTDANFSDAVEKYSLFVVDFWAPWCGLAK